MLRRLLAAGVIAVLILGPFGWAIYHGFGWGSLAALLVTAFSRAMQEVGVVVIPQVLLAVAVFGLALEQIVQRIAGVPARETPAWLDPAVESALLLGMLGTISGMVNGFAGLSPERLEPGPLIHALGTALRSSLIGFGIALVGVWARVPSAAAAPEAPS